MAVPAPKAVPESAGKRLAALDRMRGVAMVLMTVDHASGVFNAGRLVTDGPMLYTPGTALPAAQFLTRWLTHLCAPTFVLLAGTALALSAERRRSGATPAGFDRFVLTRGILIAALDPLWMSWVFVPGGVLLQVLYAIGGSLVLMVALRRLAPAVLLVLAGVLLLGGEALTGLALLASDREPTLPAALLLSGGRFGRLIVAYPLLPWSAMMILGWVLGRRLLVAGPGATARLLVRVGTLALLLFVVVRGLNGYGNMQLPREDVSLVQWLHVSKYPPSLAYVSLELGLMALLLAAFLHLEPRRTSARPGPLLVLGQTALFFYLLHVHLLTLAAWLLGAARAGALAATWAAAAATLIALYPACLWYRAYKQARPDGWTRYI
jgi:uncharacterized membrane protein